LQPVSGCVDLCSIVCNDDDTYNLSVSVNPANPNITSCNLIFYDVNGNSTINANNSLNPFYGVPNVTPMQEQPNFIIGQCYTIENIPTSQHIGVLAQLNDPNNVNGCYEGGPPCYNTYEINESFLPPECNFHSSAPTICDYPVNLICSVSGQDIVITWGSVSSALSYEVCWGYLSTNTPNCTTVTTNSFTIPGSQIDPCQQFLYYKVKTNCTATLSSSFSPIQQDLMSDKFTCQLACGFSNIEVFSIDCNFLFGNGGYFQNCVNKKMIN